MKNRMKKHAILIMAHNQFKILEKLVQQLDHARNDIYIHIDKHAGKFDMNRITSLCQNASVFFIPRMRVYWGDSTMVECELMLMEAALTSGEDYAYLHLLSGVDLQIKNSSDIFAFFDAHPEQQFIALRNPISGISGMNRYYYFMRLRAYNKYIARILDMISAFIQKKQKVDRLQNSSYRICKCQQWFSITKPCAEYIISQRNFIEEFVRYTCCSDEMAIGTVIANSPFWEQVYQPYRSTYGHMRLIDRDRCEKASPHTFTIEDWDIIKTSPCFWARKFSLKKDSEVIDKIVSTWGSK